MNCKKQIWGILLLFAALGQVYADEGMWVLKELNKQNLARMKELGFIPTYEQLYSETDPCVANAVVIFGGGCTGITVSQEGLIFTNHHCGYSSIQQLSSVEHDYLKDGFVSQKKEEELPVPGLSVQYLKETIDVTNRINRVIAPIGDEYKRLMAADSVGQVLCDSIGRNEFKRAQVIPFYSNNKYYLVVYNVYRDVRLVFTPPSSVGKFGGDTDNWMWPRHTGDFSVFRVYANANNEPASYSSDNKSYSPKYVAEVSLQGYEEKDYAMTVGFPGSTSRYLCSWGVKQRIEDSNIPRIEVRGVKQEIWKKAMLASDAVRIKYASKYAGSSNYWKNSIGMNKCIDSIGLVNQKRAYEEQIAQWQDTAKHLTHKVDFPLLEKLYARRSRLTKAMTQWSETFSRRSNIEFNARALRLMNEQQAKGSKKGEYFQFEDNADQWDAATDADMMAALLKNYREKADNDFLPTAVYNTIDKRFKGDYRKYADWLFKTSVMLKGGKIYFATKQYAKDPGVAYAKAIKAVYDKIMGENGKGWSLADSIAVQERYLCDAKVQMEMDKPHYSDANFTMRLSYGQVKPLALGTNKAYYTTAKSLLDKMAKGDKGVIDYQAEPIMRTLMSANDFGKYTDPVSHTLNLCFLTNNDITGGNSGSPMFDGKGQLIGLAFDGNWDSLSSDINFDSNLARCIGVDIRYVVYMIDKWGHADRLLKEIGVEK